LKKEGSEEETVEEDEVKAVEDAPAELNTEDTEETKEEKSEDDNQE